MRGPLGLVFFGTSEFALPCLQSLLDSPHDLLCAVTRPPRPAGRGKRLRQPPVSTYLADGYSNIEVHQPERLDGDFITFLKNTGPDMMVTAAYGAWLPGRLLTAAPLGVVNVHPSLLPLYRGAAPVTRAILDGRKETGVSFMLTDEGWDTGPLIAAFSLRIGEDDTSGTLEGRLARLAGEKVVQVLEGYAAGLLCPVPQSGEAVYADKVRTEETWIDWSRPAPELERMVRAFQPSPGARTSLRGRLIKILAAEVVDRSIPPGEVVAGEDGLTVGCGADSLRVLRLQPSSRRAMTAQEFLRGFQLEDGAGFESP